MQLSRGPRPHRCRRTGRHRGAPDLVLLGLGLPVVRHLVQASGGDITP
ncbi:MULTISPECIES: hypothetical protein [unclassified Streptomyces]|nr:MULTISPECIES: hypothetical protein [unclassified Streptomyces]